MRTDYHLLTEQVRQLAQTEGWYASLLANVSALLMDTLEDLNWAGFYILRNGQLTVGPFQGKPACIHIAPGKGVCGTALEQDEILVVPDVHAFPGHIACDSASRSEIVLPLHRGGAAAAVLDIDSPRLSRFSEEDREGLAGIVKLLEDHVVWE